MPFFPIARYAARDGRRSSLVHSPKACLPYVTASTRPGHVFPRILPQTFPPCRRGGSIRDPPARQFLFPLEAEGGKKMLNGVDIGGNDVPLRVSPAQIYALSILRLIYGDYAESKGGVTRPVFEDGRNGYWNREDRPSGLAATRGGPAIEKSIVLQLTRSATAFLNATQPRGRTRTKEKKNPVYLVRVQGKAIVHL